MKYIVTLGKTTGCKKRKMEKRGCIAHTGLHLSFDGMRMGATRVQRGNFEGGDGGFEELINFFELPEL